MPIDTEDNIAGPYVGDGVVADFDTPYFQRNADIRAILVTDATGAEVLQVLDTDYTLTGALLPDGGTLTMTTPPAVGETLHITVDPTQTQAANIAANLATTQALDKLTQLVQQLQLAVDRSIKIPEAERLAGTVAAILGTAADRANQVLSFGVSGAVQNALLTGDNVAAGTIPISKIQDGTANRLLGFDASGAIVEIVAGDNVTVNEGEISATGSGPGGAGDMLAAVYDPQAKQADAFQRAQHTGSQAISTVVGLQIVLDGKEPLITYPGPTFAASATYDPVADAGRFVAFDVDSNAVEITLPDVATAPDDMQFWIRVNSATNLASIAVATANQLRSDNGYHDHGQAIDRVYLGLSQAAQAGTWAFVYKRNSLYHIVGQLRQNSGDDLSFGSPGGITADQLEASIGLFDANAEPTDFTFEQADKDKFTDWTGGTTATVPLLSGGTLLVGRRNAGGVSDGTLSLSGGVTTADSLTITDGNMFTILYVPGTSEVEIRQS
ncbi:MAG: hypothetical protein ACR2QF_10865 [Geminicoccaceae bacterium]